MRYMFLVMAGAEVASKGPPPRLLQEIGKLSADAQSAGTIVGRGALMPITQAVRARVKGGKLTITDGPFAEAKEVLGGYAIFELPSREAAIEAMRAFMELHVLYGEGWEGVCEMREMAELPGPPSR